jgi:hypothetical protein
VSAQHRRPLLAFLLVFLVCVILLGHAVRSEALLGLLTSAGRDPLGSEQVRLTALTRDRVVADAKQVRSPRAPAPASATPVHRVRTAPTGHAKSLPTPMFEAVDGGGLHPQKAEPVRPGLAKKPGGLPPGLAKQADKHADGALPPGQARKADKGADKTWPGPFGWSYGPVEELPPGQAKKT